MFKEKFKQKKGITLVALVITVIVLLILAGVTLNIVLNGGIINKSENAVAKYQDTSKNEDDQINYLDAIFGNFLANVTGASTSGGGSSNPPVVATQWTIETDNGDTGLSVGDLVKPTISSVASEKFYIIGKDDTTVTLLAQYCVDWETANAQDNTMGIYNSSTNTTSGALVFRADNTTDNANIYSASDIKGYVDAYASKLVAAGLTLEDVEIAEGGSAVSGTKGRLIWGTTNGTWNAGYTIWTYVSGTGEIGALLDAGKTEIVYGTEGAKLKYWIGCSDESNTSSVWCVNGYSGSVGPAPCTVMNLGLRPVIKVLQSKF